MYARVAQIGLVAVFATLLVSDHASAFGRRSASICCEPCPMPCPPCPPCPPPPNPCAWDCVVNNTGEPIRLFIISVNGPHCGQPWVRDLAPGHCCCYPFYKDGRDVHYVGYSLTTGNKIAMGQFYPLPVCHHPSCPPPNCSGCYWIDKGVSAAAPVAAEKDPKRRK
jgi:hypothetical protein